MSSLMVVRMTRGSPGGHFPHQDSSFWNTLNRNDTFVTEKWYVFFTFRITFSEFWEVVLPDLLHPMQRSDGTPYYTSHSRALWDKPRRVPPNIQMKPPDKHTIASSVCTPTWFPRGDISIQLPFSWYQLHTRNKKYGHRCRDSGSVKVGICQTSIRTEFSKQIIEYNDCCRESASHVAPWTHFTSQTRLDFIVEEVRDIQDILEDFDWVDMMKLQKHERV